MKAARFLLGFLLVGSAAAQTMTGGGAGSVTDAAYNAATWLGDTTNAPSRNAIRNKIEAVVAGGGLGTTDIDSSAKIKTIVTDEIGFATGKLLFVASIADCPTGYTNYTASTGAIGCGSYGSGWVTAFGSAYPTILTKIQGTLALSTTSIAANTCATVQTATATGAASTDIVNFSPNASVKAVTGYAPVGTLTITAYATTNTVNFDVCNKDQTNAVNPGAVTLNWIIVK